MKRSIHYLILVCLSFPVFLSCVRLDNKPISHKLSFHIGSENSMYRTTKATASDIFDEFYAKLSTGELVAETYNLTFTDINTGKAYSFSGTWKGAEVELYDATYKVTGTSTATGSKTQEKCSVYFDETITVTSQTNNIVLNAYYDCFLFVLTGQNLSHVDGCFLFNNKYWYAFVNGSFVETLTGTRKNGANFSVDMSGYSFVKGKYYIYEDIAINNSGIGFLIPKMDNGLDGWDGFRLKATSENTVLVLKLQSQNKFPNRVLYYSFDTQNWSVWNYNYEIHLDYNQILYLKGNKIFGDTSQIEAKSGSAYGSGYICSLLDNGTNYTTTAIPDQAFQGMFYNGEQNNVRITAELKFPDVVRQIGSKYLYGYTCYGPNWTSVILSNNLEFIGCTCFEQNRMTQIIIPRTVKYIGNAAFNCCSYLTTVYFTGTVAEWKAVEKGDYKWSDAPPAKKIICTDGEADF